jgi:hypothetical protein
MKLLAELISPLLLAGVVWAGPPQARPGLDATHATACEQEWQAMAQRHRDEADAMLKESSGMRALLTMLRNDAGIVRENAVKDGLQVSADMWEMMLGTFQRQATSLETLAQQEESKGKVLCGAGAK